MMKVMLMKVIELNYNSWDNIIQLERNNMIVIRSYVTSNEP